MSALGDTVDSSDEDYYLDGKITVYILAPHPYNGDYDELLTDNIETAIEAAHDLVEDIFDNIDDNGIKASITITQCEMSRGEYEIFTDDCP